MTPSRYKLSIRIFGRDVDPDAVSLRLEATPTLAYRRGDPHLSKDGKQTYRPWPSSMWNLHCPLNDEASLEDHLAWADTFVGARLLAFQDDVAQGFNVDLFIGAFTEATLFGIEVQLADYPCLCRVGLRLGFDIYAGQQKAAPE